MNAYPNEGYFYVICGPAQYFEEAERSIDSLKALDHEAHVTALVDYRKHMTNKLFNILDNIIDLENIIDDMSKKKAFLFKSQHIFFESPYTRTFFIDTDTYFIESPRSLFDLLEYYDLCLAHGTHDRETLTIGGNTLDGYTPYNTGVMLFRKNDHTTDLFSRWTTIYEEQIDNYITDQPALMKALLNSECKLYVLQNNYNARFIYPEKYVGKVAILHGRHHSVDSIARKINASDRPRLWLPWSEICVYEGSSIMKGLEILWRAVAQKLRC